MVITVSGCSQFHAYHSYQSTLLIPTSSGRVSMSLQQILAVQLTLKQCGD